MNEGTTKKKGVNLLLILAIAVAIVVTVLVVSANSRKYNKAYDAFARGEYYTAVELFGELGDYKDSGALYLQSSYGLADRYYNARDYAKALDLFQKLGEYEDSVERAKACYHGLGDNALERLDFDEAIEYYTSAGDYSDSADMVLASYYAKGKNALEMWEFELARECFVKADGWRNSSQMIQEAYYQEGEFLMIDEAFLDANAAFLTAGDYKDAPARANEAVYEQAHMLFMAGDYTGAQPYFDMLQGYPEGEGPHFVNLEDARSYLEEQATVLNPSIVCYIMESPKATYSELRDMMQNYISFQLGSVSYVDYSKKLKVEADYYPGDRILYAWRTGDDSVLSEDELKAKGVAEKIVKKAKSKKNAMETQLYLYNWLCNIMKYETPNMHVSTEAYLKLRQLTCVGALLDGKANCQGYTDAFYLLGNMAGFDVCRVFGKGDGEGHAWNGITLDDKMYLVDVTFGDWDEIGSKAKGYIQFNCAFDPETYAIDGGTEVFPELVTGEDLSQTYYKYKKSIFKSQTDAANYLARQCKKNGKGWYVAVVDDKIISSSKMISALKRARTKNGVYNGFTTVVNTYGGDTHIAVKWN